MFRNTLKTEERNRQKLNKERTNHDTIEYQPPFFILFLAFLEAHTTLVPASLSKKTFSRHSSCSILVYFFFFCHGVHSLHLMFLLDISNGLYKTQFFTCGLLRPAYWSLCKLPSLRFCKLVSLVCVVLFMNDTKPYLLRFAFCVHLL